MKKYILFLFLAFALTSAFSQSETKFNLHPETGEIYYSEVINIEGKSKNDLFVSARTWFANTFVSSKNVIQYSDKKEGIIIGKGNFKVKNGRVNFTVKISSREGRFKYELYNFIYDAGIIQTHGDLRQEKKSGGGMWPSHWRKARKQAMVHIPKLIISLNDGMIISKVLPKDDW
tara:strand:- start:45 stop:566 length:522 start_codon:yes stop_codon:yes gene_type:complete